MNLRVEFFVREYGEIGEVRYEFSEGDELIGIASISSKEAAYCLHYISVMPDVRGKGYGSQILESICQKLSDKPIMLELDTTSPFGGDNLRAWYVRHGFTTVSDNWMVRSAKSPKKENGEQGIGNSEERTVSYSY